MEKKPHRIDIQGIGKYEGFNEKNCTVIEQENALSLFPRLNHDYLAHS